MASSSRYPATALKRSSDGQLLPGATPALPAEHTGVALREFTAARPTGVGRRGREALNAANVRRVPNDAPRGFVRPRWEKCVFTGDNIDRWFYETCALSELSKALRARP